MRTTEDEDEDDDEAPDLIDTDDEDDSRTIHPRVPSEKTNTVTEEEEEAWEDTLDDGFTHPSAKAVTTTGDDPMEAWYPKGDEDGVAHHKSGKWR